MLMKKNHQHKSGRVVAFVLAAVLTVSGVTGSYEMFARAAATRANAAEDIQNQNFFIHITSSQASGNNYKVSDFNITEGQQKYNYSDGNGKNIKGITTKYIKLSDVLSKIGVQASDIEEIGLTHKGQTNTKIDKLNNGTIDKYLFTLNASEDAFGGESANAVQDNEVLKLVYLNENKYPVEVSEMHVKCHIYKEEIIKPATCTDNGEKRIYCPNCNGGTENREPIDKLSKDGTHSYDEGTVTKEATCAENGQKEYKCTRCNATKSEQIPATGAHDRDDGTVTKEVTCTQDGKKVFKCKKCGKELDTAVIAAKGHVYDEGTVTKEVTCTENGVKTYKCKNCTDTKEESIPARGDHVYDDGSVTTPATCGKDGVKTFTCKDCSNKYTESIPATGAHEYEDKVTKQATCTENGEKTFYCKGCDQKYTEPIAATGHAYDNGKVTKQPTCTAEGVKTYECEHCHDKQNESIPKVQHSYDNGSVIKEATCTVDGEKAYKCKNCPETKKEPIPAKGIHTYDDGKVTTEATCGKDGVRTYTCVDCGDKQTEAIAKTDAHEYESKVTKQPTCTENGEKTFSCKGCDKKYTEKIEAKGHSYDDGKVTKEATCAAEGTKTYTCADCNDKKIEAIPKTNTHGYRRTAKAPATGTDAEAALYECDDCEDSYVSENVKDADDPSITSRKLVEAGASSVSEEEAFAKDPELANEINIAKGDGYEVIALYKVDDVEIGEDEGMTVLLRAEGIKAGETYLVIGASHYVEKINVKATKDNELNVSFAHKHDYVGILYKGLNDIESKVTSGSYVANGSNTDAAAETNTKVSGKNAGKTTGDSIKAGKRSKAGKNSKGAKSVKTGDRNSITLYVVLLAAAFVAVCGTIVYRKKHR